MADAAEDRPRALLSIDTRRDIERLQLDAWRRMSSIDKAAIVNQATHDVMTLALAGIRRRYPAASERECFLRLAERSLGPALVRTVYPDAERILNPTS